MEILFRTTLRTAIGGLLVPRGESPWTTGGTGPGFFLTLDSPRWFAAAIPFSREKNRIFFIVSYSEVTSIFWVCGYGPMEVSGEFVVDCFSQ